MAVGPRLHQQQVESQLEMGETTETEVLEERTEGSMAREMKNSVR